MPLQGVTTKLMKNLSSARSLSAAHDGDAGCDNAKHYLMAPMLVVPPKDSPSNIFAFSTCSISSIKRYLSMYVCVGQLSCVRMCALGRMDSLCVSVCVYRYIFVYSACFIDCVRVYIYSASFTVCVYMVNAF